LFSRKLPPTEKAPSAATSLAPSSVTWPLALPVSRAVSIVPMPPTSTILPLVPATSSASSQSSPQPPPPPPPLPLAISVVLVLAWMAPVLSMRMSGAVSDTMGASTSPVTCSELVTSGSFSVSDAAVKPPRLVTSLPGSFSVTAPALPVSVRTVSGPSWVTAPSDSKSSVVALPCRSSAAARSMLPDVGVRAKVPSGTSV
jgi:hypothetical protein